MNVLSVLSSSFTDICSGIASGRLNAERVSFANKATVCKYVVPEGYGTEPKAGLEISIDEEAIAREGAMVYYAMVDKKGDKIFTTTSVQQASSASLILLKKRKKTVNTPSSMCKAAPSLSVTTLKG